MNDSDHRWNGGPEGAWMMIVMLHDLNDAVNSPFECFSTEASRMTMA